MRKRINDGSEEYFNYEQLHRGESELDDILADGSESDDDDLTNDPAFVTGSLQHTQYEYDAERTNVLRGLFGTIIALLILIGIFGTHSIPHALGGMSAAHARILEIAFGPLLFAFSASRLALNGPEFLRLRRELRSLQASKTA